VPQYGKYHPIFIAYVFKTAKHIGRQRNNVARLQNGFCPAIVVPVKTPLLLNTINTSAVKCECGEFLMRGGCPAAPMQKPVLLGQVHFLVLAFRYTAANDTVIVFEVTAGCFGINERCFAGYQLAKPYQSLLQ
jgi:hypothetical protein